MRLLCKSLILRIVLVSILPLWLLQLGFDTLIQWMIIKCRFASYSAREVVCYQQ
jgi:hypothetical protein